MSDGIVASPVVPPQAAVPVQAPGQPPAVAKPAAAPPVEKPVDVDPYEELLKSKPLSLKNKAGKSVTITDRKSLEHYINKGWSAGEVAEQKNRLETENKSYRELLEKLESGDDVSVDMLRKGFGPKWKQIVQKEALRDFEEEERMKDIPPHIREKLDEAARLREEKATRDANDAHQKATQAQREQQHQLEQLQEEVKRIGIPVLQKLGFPSNPPPGLINKLAGYMSENIELARERGVAELPIEMVADALREDMQAEGKAMVSKFMETKDFDGAVKWLGEDFINFMRRGDLARLRGAGNPPPPGAGAPPPPPAGPPKKDFWSP